MIYRRSLSMVSVQSTSGELELDLERIGFLPTPYDSSTYLKRKMPHDEDEMALFVGYISGP